MSRSAQRSAIQLHSTRGPRQRSWLTHTLSTCLLSTSLHLAAASPIAFGIGVGLAPGNASAQAAQAEDADAARQRANAARIAAQERCKSDPELHGAWVANLRPDPADDKKWLADILVELEAAADQRKTLESILKTDVAIANEIQIPVRKLAARLQKRLEERFEKGGTFIAGAYVSETNAGVLQLSLFGRVPVAGQQDVAESECVALM